MEIPFVGPTYLGRSKNFNSSRSVNFYLEGDEFSPKSRAGMFGTHGLKAFADAPNGVVRAMHEFADGIFLITGNELRFMTNDSILSPPLGITTTLTGRVDIADNGLTANGVGGNQLCIVDGQNAYIYNVVTKEFYTVPDLDIPGKPFHVTYMDGYFIVINNTMTHYSSALYDGKVWPGLAYGSVIASPDNIQNVINLHEQLLFIKSTTTEVWTNVGQSTDLGSPFQRYSGAVYDYGTMAPWSVARGKDTIFLLATQRTTSGSSFAGVAMIQSYQLEIISPASINYFISQSTNLTNCFGYCFSDAGHLFYVLTNPDDDWTLVFDASTKMWHEWSTYKGNPYNVGRHLSNTYATLNGRHFVGSYKDSTIYEMSTNYTTDDGLPIVSFRITPHLYDPDMLDNVFIHELVVDMETGVGDNSYLILNDSNVHYADSTCFASGTCSAGAYVSSTLSPGGNPRASLAWSNDGGKTWSSEYFKYLGKAGEYKTQLRWTRLGKAKDRVFRLTISDPVRKCVLGARAEVSV